MVYSATQVGIKGDELRTGKDVIPPDVAVWIDFVGDQVLTYLLLSSASVGAYEANAFRIDTAAAAAVAMSFMTFFSLAPAALISGYHLFNHLQ